METYPGFVSLTSNSRGLVKRPLSKFNLTLYVRLILYEFIYYLNIINFSIFLNVRIHVKLDERNNNECRIRN